MVETKQQKRQRLDYYALMVHRLQEIARAYSSMAHEKTVNLQQSGLTFQAINDTMGQVMQDFLPKNGKRVVK